MRKIYIALFCRVATLRGHYHLSLSDSSVRFSAPTPTLVHRNVSRFDSEQGELEDFIGEINPGDVIYDVGANTGLYSLFAASKHRESKLFAFEPYPPNVKMLEQDIPLNQLHNVEVIEKALSDSNGTVEFDQPADSDVGYGSSSITVDRSESTVEVPTVTGDQLIAEDQIPEPNIIKIDVEGAEPLVIAGLERALSAPSCRVVYCEVHLPGVDIRPSVEDFGSSPGEVKAQLEGFGFTVEELYTRGDNEVFYKATKTQSSAK